MSTGARPVLSSEGGLEDGPLFRQTCGESVQGCDEHTSWPWGSRCWAEEAFMKAGDELTGGPAGRAAPGALAEDTGHESF